MKSNSWRFTMPLREARRWISTALCQSKRYVKLALGITKRIYQALPLSFHTKKKHRQLVARVFPQILRASGTELSLSTCLNRAARLEFPLENEPKVTIIIPIYGKIDYTLLCLESIAENLPSVKFEVIVVDDCSPDDSLYVLSKIKNIRLLSNDVNQGFIRTCNSGTSVAKGEYLYFLNNDTEVTSGWLDSLVQTFDDFSNVGLVGSKLIYPDGRLQEAGGIIWSDGSAWNFGHSDNPNLPIYNYAREVDYCSGASIMVPKRIFIELGGFDEYFLPAYCEDSDLAIKVRNFGYKVIYQPASIVIHHEGITSGTDISSGVKSYQIENTKKIGRAHV